MAQNNYKPKLTGADIQAITSIYMAHFREKGLSSRGAPEDWFNVILDFLRIKQLEIAPEGTMEAYKEVMDGKASWEGN